MSCTICLEPLKEATSLPCGHLFCAPCIQTYIETCYAVLFAECPLCRYPFNEIDFRRTYLPELEDASAQAATISGLKEKAILQAAKVSYLEAQIQRLKTQVKDRSSLIRKLQSSRLFRSSFVLSRGRGPARQIAKLQADLREARTALQQQRTLSDQLVYDQRIVDHFVEEMTNDILGPLPPAVADPSTAARPTFNALTAPSGTHLARTLEASSQDALNLQPQYPTFEEIAPRDSNFSIPGAQDANRYWTSIEQLFGPPGNDPL
ncbi:unnamed protein product [Somion occarium]|uniref:RING-type domain-containing protein n=1 Tax=Somion occarium TaxID=3059160 RepID=A0ABP1DQJ6_9APHY